MKCKICYRASTGKYCEFLEKAYRNIVRMCDVWKGALDISWGEYLKELVKNAYTGSWIKDVAEQLIREG